MAFFYQKNLLLKWFKIYQAHVSLVKLKVWRKHFKWIIDVIESRFGGKDVGEGQTIPEGMKIAK